VEATPSRSNEGPTPAVPRHRQISKNVQRAHVAHATKDLLALESVLSQHNVPSAAQSTGVPRTGPSCASTIERQIDKPICHRAISFGRP
jgi:hypothetical protein